jgi:tocopherol O-methyltransferase
MIDSTRTETPDTVASHYDDLDGFYRSIWGTHVHHGLWLDGGETVEQATDNLLRHAVAGVPLTSASRVCDVGCGYGETSRLLARETGAAVVGYTVSRAQYDFAVASANGAPSNPRFVLQDWLTNDLEDASIDLVLAIESSEHMPDILRFFAEAARVLAPGGSLRVCAWITREQPGALERRLLLGPICTEGRVRLCTETEYAAMIEGAGLTLEAADDITDRVKKTWTICVQRLAVKLATDADARHFVLRGPSKNKEFALTPARMRIAYETGSLRYLVFRASKPADPR